MYKINEIFYTLQGEGGRQGMPSVFIRFAECNLACNFCDTEFESFKEMTIEDIVNELKIFNCQWVVLTGGEPLLQIDAELMIALRTAGAKIALETNGSLRPPAEMDYITISPKVAEHVLKTNFTGIKVDEIRYARHKGQGIPKPQIEARRKYISPLFDGDKLNMENLKYCIDLVKKHPDWSLSIQSHKLIGIR